MFDARKDSKVGSRLSRKLASPLRQFVQKHGEKSRQNSALISLYFFFYIHFFCFVFFSICFLLLRIGTLLIILRMKVVARLTRERQALDQIFIHFDGIVVDHGEFSQKRKTHFLLYRGESIVTKQSGAWDCFPTNVLLR